jgi:hypothetical protein
MNKLPPQACSTKRWCKPSAADDSSVANASKDYTLRYKIHVAGLRMDVGHLEFGELHRPIWCEGMDDTCSRYDPGDRPQKT